MHAFVRALVRRGEAKADRGEPLGRPIGVPGVAHTVEHHHESHPKAEGEQNEVEGGHEIPFVTPFNAPDRRDVPSQNVTHTGMSPAAHREPIPPSPTSYP